MFNVKEENSRAVEAALAVLRKYSRGDVVPHGELAEAVGFEPPDAEYFRLVMRARERFKEEDGKWSHEVRSVGFAILTAAQTLLEEPVRRARKIRRQIRKYESAAAALPEGELTFHQRRQREAVLAAARAARKEARDQERHVKWLARPTATNPKRLPIQ